jgi:hypothetical protein
MTTGGLLEGRTRLTDSKAVPQVPPAATTRRSSAIAVSRLGT